VQETVEAYELDAAEQSALKTVLDAEGYSEVHHHAEPSACSALCVRRSQDRTEP
jgi:hypothetical protein